MTAPAWGAFVAAVGWVAVYLLVIASEGENEVRVVAVVAAVVTLAGACLPVAAALSGSARRIVAAIGTSALVLVAILAALSIGVLLLPAVILAMMATMRA